MELANIYQVVVSPWLTSISFVLSLSLSASSVSAMSEDALRNICVHSMSRLGERLTALSKDVRPIDPQLQTVSLLVQQIQERGLNDPISKLMLERAGFGSSDRSELGIDGLKRFAEAIRQLLPIVPADKRVALIFFHDHVLLTQFTELHSVPQINLFETAGLRSFMATSAKIPTSSNGLAIDNSAYWDEVEKFRTHLVSMISIYLQVPKFLKSVEETLVARRAESSEGDAEYKKLPGILEQFLVEVEAEFKASTEALFKAFPHPQVPAPERITRRWSRIRETGQMKDIENARSDARKIVDQIAKIVEQPSKATKTEPKPQPSIAIGNVTEKGRELFVWLKNLVEVSKAHGLQTSLPEDLALVGYLTTIIPDASLKSLKSVFTANLPPANLTAAKIAAIRLAGRIEEPEMKDIFELGLSDLDQQVRIRALDEIRKQPAQLKVFAAELIAKAKLALISLPEASADDILEFRIILESILKSEMKTQEQNFVDALYGIYEDTKADTHLRIAAVKAYLSLSGRPVFKAWGFDRKGNLTAVAGSEK